MRDPWSLSDHDLDRLLAGKAPNGGDPVDRELAAFVRDVRTAFLAQPAAETERRHLAAALEVSRLTADNGDPGVRPASKAHGPGHQLAFRTSGRQYDPPSGPLVAVGVKDLG